jgi:organic hydroperoxide reductase OsmC/OhrA
MAAPTTDPTLLCTARTHTVGGRVNGHAQSEDGNLDVRLATPGSGRPSTNPEQLLAAGVDRATAATLIADAEATCPYSKALRGNVDTTITLI